MKPQHKRIIAKEIIILTGTVIIGALVWSVIFLRNEYFVRKVKNETKEASILQQQIDSVEKIPPVKLLYPIFTDKLYLEYQLKLNVKFDNPLTKNEIYTNEDILKINAHDLSSLILTFCDSLFLTSLIEFIPPKDGETVTVNKLKIREVVRWEEPTSDHDYVYAILNELKEDSSKQEILHLVYNFFYSNKYLMRDFDEFISTLKGNPFSPKSPIWLKYQRNLNEKKQLEKELSKTKNKVLSASEINENSIQVFFILLMLIYPVRLFILLLLWSFKTLREIKNE